MTVEKSNITLVQVAEAAGVSSMTVSRVLNGNRAKVKSSTFERVEQVIRDLNYVPNISARALAGARNFRIGLVYSASAPFSFFLDSLVVNTLDALTKIGMHTSVIKLSKIVPMREKIDELRRAMADLDGVIVPAPLADQPQMRCFLESLEKPAVLLSGRPGRRGANRVCIDDFSAAKEMTEYLLSLGREQIAFVTGGPNYDSAQREQGYRSALENSGKTIDEELICEGAYTFESGLKAGEMLLSMKSKPTAIFAGNDEMALGCIAAASNLGISVPEDVSIAGFDGSPLSVCVTPSLTSVSQPLDRIAELAVQVLNKELNTSDKTEADGFERGPMIVPHKMIIGGSTAKVAPKR